MMSNNEDRNVTISTQIISASLTMITVVGAFAVFVIEKRAIGFAYYAIAGSAFLSFVVSIFLGGKGLSGKGSGRKPNPYFNWQAITALLGIILFCVSVFLGKEKPDDLERRISEQELLIMELRIRNDNGAQEIDTLRQRLEKLTKRFNEAEKRTSEEILALRAKRSVAK